MKKSLIIVYLLINCVFVFANFTFAEGPFIHSHNDYLKANPLYGALLEGADSIEADVHLLCGKLYTGHGVARISKKTNFENQYLIPLYEIYQKQGFIREENKTLILLVDVKSSARSTWKVLSEILIKYSDMLTEFNPNIIKWNAVSVIISGNSARNLIWEDENRLAAVDGRTKDIGVITELHKIPLISDNWSNLFRVKADGVISEKDLSNLRELVTGVHSNKQILRFYGGYESEEFVKLLIRENVDIINADDISQVKGYFGD